MDGTARIWDAISGKLLRTLSGHTNAVNTATFSPDGKRILTSSNDNTSRIWDSESGQSLYTLTGHTGLVYDCTALLLDIRSSRLHTARGWVRDATFSPDGKRIVTAGADGKACIWNAENGELMDTLVEHTMELCNVLFSRDGSRIVTTCRDDTARIFDALSGELLRKISGVLGAGGVCIFSPDGTKIIGKTHENEACIWDVVSGEILYRMSYYVYFSAAAYSPDGKKIVASGDYEATILDAESGLPIINFSGPSSGNYKSKFSPNHQNVITYFDDYKARIWDIFSGESIQTFLNYPYAFEDINFSPDGKSIVTIDRDTIRIWDASRGLLSVKFSGRNTFKLNNVKYSQDGKSIITSSVDDTIRIWKASSGSLLKKISLHKIDLNTADFSPDGKKIIWTGQDDTVRILDAFSNVVLRKLFDSSMEKSEVNSGVFSSDGNKIATANDDNRARIWDANSGKLLHRLIGHADAVNAASFSPDGKRIVTSSDDNTARIWDVATGEPLKILTGHTFNVEYASWSPDGKTIITTGADHKTIIWDAATGKPRYTRLQLSGNDWLVYDEYYRFDGTEGAINYLYFTCGLEVVELAQLKDSLWVPGLAEKIMNGEEILINDKPAPKLKNLNICEFTPLVELHSRQGNKLRYRIVPRRGGLGKVELLINGIPTYTYEPEQLEGKKEESMKIFYLNLDSDTLHRYLYGDTGRQNPIEVKASVKGSGIYGKGNETHLFRAKNTGELPRFYGVFVGINDYNNPQKENSPIKYKNLDYAIKDAEEMANTLQLAAESLFSKDSCFIYRLTGKDSMAPTRENLQRVLSQIGKQARACDVLFLFFSGHGDLNKETTGNQIRFMMQKAEKTNKKTNSFGTDELTEWCHPTKMKAAKRLFVFDACHSSQFIIENQHKGYDESKRIRQLDALKDKNGLMILAASAENESAFEDPTLKQGVLTYYMLMALKIKPKDTALIVKNWAEESIALVRDYCRQNNRQEPRSFGDGYFEIGNVTDTLKKAISISCPKNRISKCHFVPGNRFTLKQKLNLHDSINALLSNNNDEKGLVLSSNANGAFEVNGFYFYRNNKYKIGFEISGLEKKNFFYFPAKKYNNVKSAADEIVKKIAYEIERQATESREKNCRLMSN
jgi:WD40 repeat protein